MTIQNIIDKLDLKPHPEGGYFRETYRCEEIVNDRNFSTCIYFLLTKDNFSSFHRIKQDEIWHFYDGATIKLHVITNTGNYYSKLIGKNLIAGEEPQVIVNAGDWFAAEVISSEKDYALVGCTVSPGFDFEDFELATRKNLLEKYPNHAEVIVRLTR